MNKSTKIKRRKIDEHVGKRLRHFRKFRGFSQEKLATRVDLTFQQLQKYENGTNRISASVLYEFSNILKVPVSCFFEGLEKQTPELLPALDKKHYDLIRLYNAAPKNMQRDFLRFLKTVGNKNE